MGKEGYLCSAVEGHQHIDVRRKLLVRIAGHGHGGVRHKNLRILRSFEQTGLECPLHGDLVRGVFRHRQIGYAGQGRTRSGSADLEMQ